MLYRAYMKKSVLASEQFCRKLLTRVLKKSLHFSLHHYCQGRTKISFNLIKVLHNILSRITEKFSCHLIKITRCSCI